MLRNAIVQQALKEMLSLDDAALEAHLAEAKKRGVSLEQYVLEQNMIKENELYQTAAPFLHVQFTNLDGVEFTKELLDLIPAPLAQTHHVIAWAQDEQSVSIAMLDPIDVQTIEFIHRKTGKEPHVFLTTPKAMRLALRAYHADIESDLRMNSDKRSGAETDEKDKLKKEAEELPVINIVKSILEHAVYESASDIHIEPTENTVIVRYRVDGVLRGVMSLPKKVQNGITARIKILANLKIDEHMVPQDGRFKIEVQDEQLAFRVSIIPVYDGEKIVMRLLHEGEKPLTLDQLGFLPGPKELVKEAIGKPHGMVLVTGPTGSGKTTTLYSVLGMLNQPEVNISTIEDPIEYHITGINQSQVNSRVGFDFASGLRAFLRQDPDIIMVGEIRDKETAEIAIHAAMTGHLVLSTLHTNDAPTTIPRLLDMDIPPFLVAFTANIIIAQRLVRRICEHCKESFTLGEDAVSELSRAFDTQSLTALFQQFDVALDSDETDLQSMKFFRGGGCKQCSNSGYKGRIGIYEVLDIDDDMTEKINGRATAAEIGEYAREKGMVTMMQDGLVKAKQGVTTLEEVMRVTRE